MNGNTNIKFGVLTLIIIGAVFFRLALPLMPNFSPLGATCLLGAAHFDKKWKAFLVPIAATWLSDIFVINVIYADHYPEFTLLYSGFYWQYASYALIVLFGRFLYAKNISAIKIAVGGVGAGLIFFIVSNFGVWASGSTYSPDLGGLINCYVAGIPFYKGSLLGNLFYSVLLFGTYYLLQKRFVVLKSQGLKYV